MNALLAWGRQPTTVAGMSALAATLTGIVLNQLNWAQAVPLIIGAAASIILPDNSQAKQDAEALARDIVAKTIKS